MILTWLDPSDPIRVMFSGIVDVADKPIWFRTRDDPTQNTDRLRNKSKMSGVSAKDMFPFFAC